MTKFRAFITNNVFLETVMRKKTPFKRGPRSVQAQRNVSASVSEIKAAALGRRVPTRIKSSRPRTRFEGDNAARKSTKPRFIDLFAGIGGIRLGLERAGGECVFSSEWDKDAATSYEAFFGDRPAGDITKISNSDIPDHDILAGGFPCQAFSIIGDKKGFGDTRGTLFFEIERILRDKRPRAILLENVRNLVSHDKGRTFNVVLDRLRELGYHVHWRVLNALDFNLPQKRERVIIVGFMDNHPFEWPTAKPLTLTLADVLEKDSDVPRKHFASEAVCQSVATRLVGKKIPQRPWICHENKSGNISPLPYSCALRAGASYNYLLVNGRRRLTPRENLRLQGFPEEFPIAVSDAVIRKQCGNSVPVTMIEAVAKNLVAALKKAPINIGGLPVRLTAEQLEIFV